MHWTNWCKAVQIDNLDSDGAAKMQKKRIDCVEDFPKVDDWRLRKEGDSWENYDDFQVEIPCDI